MRSKRTSPEEQLCLVTECRKSGLTNYAWCQQHDIKVEINCLKDAADARLVRLNDGKAMNIHFYRRKSGRSATRFATSRLGVFAVVYEKAED